MHNAQRLAEDNAMLEQYGLKNMKELWKVQTEISRIRGNARQYLTGGPNTEGESKKLIGRLSRLGIVSAESAIDQVLDLKETAFLDRRLQSVVTRKGLARSMKQSRQLITHGFISINGKKVDRPGLMVSALAESEVGYYKKIEILPPEKKAEAAPAAPETKAEPIKN
jgi:small subunit ribosomal protein S4